MEKDNKKAQAIPVKKGERIVINIEDEGTKGDGLTRINNFVVITKGGQVNKKYEVEIKGVYEKFAFSKIIKEVKESD